MSLNPICIQLSN